MRMNARRWFVPVVLAALVGCAEHAAEDRGTDVFGRAPVIPSPLESRCARFKKGGGAGRACEDAQVLGQSYVRRLSSGDAVCIEGGFGDLPGRNCQARGRVADVGTNRVLIDVREARPDSKWFGREARPVWFEEGALVDLFLAERGF